MRLVTYVTARIGFVREFSQLIAIANLGTMRRGSARPVRRMNIRISKTKLGCGAGAVGRAVWGDVYLRFDGSMRAGGDQGVRFEGRAVGDRAFGGKLAAEIFGVVVTARFEFPTIHSRGSSGGPVFRLCYNSMTAL